MPDAPPPAEEQPEAYRYSIADPETRGIYRVVSRTPISQADLERLIESVIRDEGRVRTGVTRTVFI